MTYLKYPYDVEKHYVNTTKKTKNIKKMEYKKKMYRALSHPDSVPGYAEQRICDYLKENGSASSTELYALSSKKTKPLKHLLEKGFVGELIPVEVSFVYASHNPILLEYEQKLKELRKELEMKLEKRTVEELFKQGRITKEYMDHHLSLYHL